MTASSPIKLMREESDRRASGSAGVPPAVLRVPRGTRRTSTGDRITLGVRVYSAGRGIRQAGRPRYPEARRPALGPANCVRS